MSKDNLKAILKGIGLPETLIADVEKDDFKPEKVIADFHAGQKAHYTDIVKNEIKYEIEEEVTSKVEGRILNTLNNDIKKVFGIDISKIKDMPAHEKLKFAKAEMDEKSSKNPGAEEIQKLQAEKLELQNRYTELETGMNAKIEASEKKASETITTKLGEIELLKAVTETPADTLVGGAHSEGISLAVKSYYGAKYKFGTDENGNIVPVEKETNKRAVAKDGAGKEYFASVKEIVTSSLKDLKFIKESNGGQGSGQNAQGAAGNGQKQKSQHLLELEARIEKQQQ